MGWERSWSSRPGWSGCRRRRAATRAARCRIRQVPRWAASGSSRTPVAPTCWLVCGSTPRATSASGAQRRAGLGPAAAGSGGGIERAAAAPVAAPPHSATNDYVAGADEPDLVKTDGNRVITVRAWRAADRQHRDQDGHGTPQAGARAGMGCVESARRGQSRAGDLRAKITSARSPSTSRFDAPHACSLTSFRRAVTVLVPVSTTRSTPPATVITRLPSVFTRSGSSAPGT